MATVPLQAVWEGVPEGSESEDLPLHYNSKLSG